MSPQDDHSSANTTGFRKANFESSEKFKHRVHVTNTNFTVSATTTGTMRVRIAQGEKVKDVVMTLHFLG